MSKKNTNPNDSLTNPLLKRSELRHCAIPFPEIKVGHFLPALKEAIAEAKSKIEKLRDSGEQPTFSNTIEALELIGDNVDLTSSIFYNLLNADTSDELQALAEKIGPQLSNYSSDILLDAKLFERVKKVYERHGSLSLSDLTAEQQTLLENTYLDFTRNGALLTGPQKEKLRAIDEDLSKLSPQFNENVLKATMSFELHILDEKELDGLPESSLEAAAQAAKEKGKSGWLITLDAPSLVPFLKYSNHRGHRETVWRAYHSRCNGGTFDNLELIKKIVNLRFERATLLGYKTHADFVLRRRMAKSPERVHQFLDKLLKASKSAAEKELASVASLALNMGGPAQLMPWDFSYYAEKYKISLFDFNEEQLRPYFQLEKVIKGVFEHARLLYGLQFKETVEFPVYHKDVKVFEVSKEKTGEFMGLFYADFFPRPTKKGGAWMTNYYQQGMFENKMMRPHVGIVCNFTKPTKEKPSLLSLDEVETLFHEFGHALHSLLSRCHYRSISGTNVFWDFVELPSQIMENWVAEKQALDLFAVHYENGDKMPEIFSKKIKDSVKFLAGFNSLRQLNFCILDFSWHDLDPRNISDVSEHEEAATAKCRLLPHIKGSLSSTSFSHIFGGGYSAGYYSYKWAEVLDADAFEYFKEKGLFDSSVSELFEKNILSKGGSEDPMELYKRFRGREPDPNALLRKLGLI